MTKAIVLHPVFKSGAKGARAGAGERSPTARLEEAIGLARAIDLEIAGAELVPIATPSPAALLGSGSIERLGAAIAEAEIGLVILDAALSPVQQRNLEKAWKVKVIDRTGLILEIFGARARTREGQMQVELAALSYQRSRLVRSWTHLERQRGGFGFIGGPGESQLEIDRRLIDERMARLRRDLDSVKRTRGLHRQARQRVPYPVIALVGYTNAGKSTLFNRLTAARVMAADLLFATLDPTLRRLRLPSGRDVILSDTVGFISDLPVELVAAFRATLEEVLEAELVIHVRDASHAESEAQAKDVLSVLAGLGLGEDRIAAMLVAMNKIDRLDADSRERLAEQARRDPKLVPISAESGEGCAMLLAAIDRHLAAAKRECAYRLAHAEGAALAWLYRHGEVSAREDREDHIALNVRLAPADIARFQRLFGAIAGEGCP